MYEALVAHLRECAKLDKSNNTYEEAANAIEELIRKEKFHAFLWNTIQPNEMEQYISMYNAGNEKVETK
jgi:hypothetical protein